MEHEYVPFDTLQAVLRRVETEIGAKVMKMTNTVHQFGRYQPDNYVYSCMEPLLRKATERYNYVISRGYSALLGPEGNHHGGLDIYIPPSVRYYLTTPGRDFNLDFWFPFLEIYTSFLDRKFRRLTALVQDCHDEITDSAKRGLSERQRECLGGASAGLAALSKIMDCDWETASQIPSYEIVRYVIARIFIYCSELQSFQSRGRRAQRGGANSDIREYRSRLHDVRTRIDQIPEVQDYEVGLEGGHRSPRVRTPNESEANSPIKERRKSGQTVSVELVKKATPPTSSVRQMSSPTATKKHVKESPKSTTPPSLIKKGQTRKTSPSGQGAKAKPIASTVKKVEHKASVQSSPELQTRSFLKRKSVKLELPKKASPNEPVAKIPASTTIRVPQPPQNPIPTPKSLTSSQIKRSSPSTGAIPNTTSRGRISSPTPPTARPIKRSSPSTGAIPNTTSRGRISSPTPPTARPIKGPSPSTGAIAKTTSRIKVPGQLKKPNDSTKIKSPVKKKSDKK